MFPFKFILNKEIMEDADGTIFEAIENADCLTINVSWEDNVDYGLSQVENNINKKRWLIVEQI